MPSKNVTLVASGNGAVKAKSLGPDGRSPVKVKARTGIKYLLVDESGQVAPGNVTLNRVDDGLYVTIEGESSPSLVLEGYFAQAEPPPGLYGIAEGGQLYAYVPTDGMGGVQSLADGGRMPVALGGEPLGAGAPYLANSDSDPGFAILPLLLFGAGAGVAGGIIAAVSGGDDDHFTGNAENNFFEGRGGNDHFSLIHGGQDTLIYRALNAADATGGNGTDTVDDFCVGTWEATPNADRIDLSGLLIGYQGELGARYINGVPTIDPSDPITDFLNVTTSDGNTTVWIDRDGTGDAFSSTALVVLNGVETDLATLLANHQIV